MVRPLVVPNPKITMEFNGGVNGWSESHFYVSAVALSDAVLQAKATALCTKRVCALDGVNAKLFYARTSLDNVNRDSASVDISGISASPTKGYNSLGGPDPSDTTAWAYQTVQVSWPYILETGNSTTNPIEYIAGMPASVTQYGPFPYNDTPPKVSSFISIYMNELCNGSWGALGRNWAGPLYPISNIATTIAAGATPAQFVITFLAAFPPANAFTAGAYCRLQGATYSSPQKRLRLNGTYTVYSYNATTGVLIVNVPRVLVDPGFRTFGTMQAATAVIYPYVTFTARPITHRKRGKPFGSGRGRR